MKTLVQQVAEYLTSLPGEVIRYQELYETLWEVPPIAGYKNTLQATISNARKFLTKGNIYAVQGIGYIYLEDRDEDSH